MKKLEDFWAFSRAGRALGELHIDYEKQEMHPVERVLNLPAGQKLKEEHYYVQKMRYGKNAASAKEADKSTLVYNDFITLKNIPLEAYDYVVNGKAALDWIVERYCVKTDKDSGIVNDANLWGIETENNPRYPLELFCRVITVSLETMKIVRGLPELDI